MGKNIRSLVMRALLLVLAAHSMATLLPNTTSVLSSAALAQGRDQESASPSHPRRVGAVYAMTNAPTGNEVVIYRRAADGTLRKAGRIATEGLGTGPQPDGEGLGSQGALTLSEGHEWLFAVNGGSNDISVFAVQEDGGLTLVDKVASGGEQPVSLTVHEDLLYVLNDGGSGSGNITGFTVGPDGTLSPVAESTRPLSGRATDPATVKFNRDGSVLAVTEKATDRIDTYLVGDDRLASGPIVQNSVGQTPFGFAFSQRDRLIVSEAFGDRPGLGAVSSYTLSAADGALHVVSGTVRNEQTASCWVAITNSGRYVYVSNTVSDTITSYGLGRDGSLTLLNAVAGVTGAGSMPREVALSTNSRFLYTLNRGTGTVSAFRVEVDGSLTPLQTIGGLPAGAGAEGLAAR
jgi:6-phosphogluconolactonase